MTATQQRVSESVAAWLCWIAGAFAFAVGYACQKRKGGIAYGLLVLALGAGLVTVFAATSPLLDDNNKSLIFALGMLPLLNAVFDYLSYAATISLIKFGARQKNILSFLVATCDALLAYGLLIGLGSAILLTLGLINALAAAPFLDIAAIVDGLRDPATRGQYTWLYLTLFSTLLPTGVHLVIGLLSVTTWLPRAAKRWIAFQIASPDTGSLGTVMGGALAALFGAVACFAVAIPLYFGGGWVIAHFEWIGLSILSHVETIARLFGVL